MYVVLLGFLYSTPLLFVLFLIIFFLKILFSYKVYCYSTFFFRLQYYLLIDFFYWVNFFNKELY